MNIKIITINNKLAKKITYSLITFMFSFNMILEPIALAKATETLNSNLNSLSLEKLKAKSDPSINIIHKKPKINIIRTPLKFSPNPSDHEIEIARVFIEPILPLTKVKSIPNENKLLAHDLMYFEQKAQNRALTSLDEFITKYPNSKWTPSLEVNLANIYFSQGYFSKAMKYWLDAWNKTKNDTKTKPKHLANEAVTYLLEMNSRVGRIDDLKKLISQTKGRKFSGASAARLKNATDSLWAMEHSPGTSFECGPLAINSILALQHKQVHCSQLFKLLPSTKQGTNMYDVASLANKLKLPLIPVKINKNVPIPTPAIVHWKLGHYSAILRYYNGKYQVKDLTFGIKNNFWLTQDVFDKEASGEYLILANKLPAGITALTQTQAKAIWGKGVTHGRDPAKTPSNPQQCPTNINCGCKGMAQVNVFSMQSSLNIQDSPSSYTPPVGPAIDYHLNYNVDEAETSGLPAFTNFSQNWSFNYGAYLVIDTSQNVIVHPPGGGIEVYYYNPNPPTLANPYAPNLTSQAILTQTQSNPPIFTRTLPDGSSETYNVPGNVTLPQIIFMSQMADPQANSISIIYNLINGFFLITSIYDALNQETKIAYPESNQVVVSPTPISITDPFGRSDFFGYDSSYEFLQGITDVIGITSKFNYSQSNINPYTDMVSLTTPYGVTSFYQFTPPPTNNSQYPATGYMFFFPDGTSSVIENYINETKTSYFWDRQAMQNYPLDYANNNFTHCKLSKWLFDGGSIEEPVLHYEQGVSAGATYYTYTGQPNTDTISYSNNPQTITKMNNSPASALTITGISPPPLPQPGLTVGDVYDVSFGSAALPQASNNLANVSYTVVSGDTIANVMSHLATNINNNQTLNVNAMAIGQNLILNSTLNTNNSYTPMTYMGITNLTSTEPAYMTFSNPNSISNLNIQAAEFTGVATSSSDVIYFKVTNASLPSGSVTVNYNVTQLEPLSAIASGVAAAINSNASLQTAGITAQTGNNAIMSLFSVSAQATSYSYTTTGSNSEIITIGQTPGQAITSTLTGTAKASDIITITAQIPVFPLPVITASYTVLSTDNNNSIMQNLATAINNSKSMNYYGIVAQYNSNTASFNLTTNSSLVTNYSFSTSGSGSETIAQTPYYNTPQVNQYSYNVNGKVIQSIDPIGRTFTYIYDANNIDLMEVRETKGSDNYLIGKWIYENQSQPVNNQHIPLTYIDGSAQTTKYTYNFQGQIKTITDPNGNVTTYTYNLNSGANNYGYLMQIDGPMPGSNDTTSFTYDGYGHIASIINSQGYEVKYSYDSANRITQATYPDGTSQVTAYNNLDTVISTDRLNRSTTNTYNSMDQLITETDPQGQVTRYKWCTCGSIASLTDANNHTTNFHHDLNGRLITKTMADNTVINYAYDPMSRKCAKIDPLGQITAYNYNTDSTVSSVNYIFAQQPTSPQVYNYDPNFIRLTQAQNNFGPIAFTYNAYTTDPYVSPTYLGGGKIATVANPVYNNGVSSTVPTTVPTAYTYDTLGRVVNRSINGNVNSNTYTYDAMSRVTNAAYTANSFGTFNFNYENNIANNSLGDTRLASINYPNGLNANFNYLPNFNDERLANINNINNSNQVLSNYSYAYNSASEIVNFQEQNYKNKINSYKYDNDGEVTEALSNYGSTAPPIMNQNYYNYDNVYNKLDNQNSSVEVLNIGGGIQANDIITVNITGLTLNPSPSKVSYTVQTTDTLATVAQNLSTAITNSLSSYSLTAYPVGNNVHLRSASNYLVNYSVGISNSTTSPQIIASFGNNTNSNELVAITGSITPNDILNLIINDTGLSNGSVTISYTVASSDTTSTIANALTNSINTNTSLQGLHITANNYDNIISITSASPNTTGYNANTSNASGNSTASEIISLNINQNVTTQVVVSGSITAGDILYVYAYDAALSGGSTSVSYTVGSGDKLANIATSLAAAINGSSNLKSIGISAIASGNIVSINSQSINKTSYAANGTTSGGGRPITESMLVNQNTNATQNIVIGGSVTSSAFTVSVLVNNSQLQGNYYPGQELVTYTITSGESLNNIATGLATAINNDTSLQAINVAAISYNNVVYVTSASGFSTTYTAYANAGSSVTATIPNNISANSYTYNNVNEITNIGGNLTNGNNVTLKGQANTAIINTNTVTSAINIYSPNSSATTYSISTSGVNSEILNLSANNNGNINLLITGYTTYNDIVNVNIINPSLPGGQVQISYQIVKDNQSLPTLATTLVSAMNSNTSLQALGITASNTKNGTGTTSNLKVKTNVSLAAGSNQTYTNATYGNLTPPATTANSYYANQVNSLTPFKPIYDYNGNLLNDGINTYEYDAQNRLIQINETNLNQTSSFSYDALGHLVQIQESQGTTTSTKQFIWCASSMCEARDGNNNLITQYFNFGQISYSGSSATNYYLTRDELNSVREVTDATGNLIAQYNYTPYGNVTVNSGSSGQAPSVASDFQYAGYYYHQPSGLNLTMYRAYSSNLGRWLTRDPIGEAGGINLYAYVMNDPVGLSDPSGLKGIPAESYAEGLIDVINLGYPATLGAGRAASIANDLTGRSGLIGSHNGPADAFRHCLWSCLMSRFLGNSNSEFIGTNHENMPSARKHPVECTMDKHNNQMGRNAAKDSNNSCYDNCMNLLNIGQLEGLGKIPVIKIYGPLF